MLLFYSILRKNAKETRAKIKIFRSEEFLRNKRLIFYENMVKLIRMDEKNIHSGHRQRMTERFLKYPDSLSEHELLEIMLYPALPRKDTNPLAHKLLSLFGSLENVLRAEDEVLKSVDGVGEKVCAMLKLYARAADIIGEKKSEQKEKFVYLKMKEKLINELGALKEEKFFLYLLDEKSTILTKLSFCTGLKDEVLIDPKELAKSIVVLRPKRAVAIHNHLSGNPSPSCKDDETTEKLYKLLALHGVELSDHVIVSGGRAFSYHYSDKLEEIKQR